MKNDNDIITDQSKLLEEIYLFYQNLYSKQDSSDNLEVMDNFLDSIEIPQ